MCLGSAVGAEAEPAAPGGVTVSLSPVIVDLRSDEWLTTKVVNTGVGVVQHTGDSIFPTGTVGFLRQRLGAVLPTDPAVVIQLKTSDIRLSIPDAKVDQTTVQSLQHSNPKGAYVVPVVALLTESFSKTKSASAVFCVAVNGQDYLGNDARFFRFGAEGEMKDSIDAAVASLARNIAAGNATASPACEPGWEGGQAVRP